MRYDKTRWKVKSKKNVEANQCTRLEERGGGDEEDKK